MLVPHHPAATAVSLLPLVAPAAAGGARADDAVRHLLTNKRPTGTLLELGPPQ